VVMGVPVDIDPLEAILQSIRIAAGEVQYCTWMIEKLGAGDVVVHPVSVLRRPLNEGKDGEDPNIDVEERRSGPLDLNIWIKARQQATDRLVKYAKTAVDSGIAERLVRIEESQAAIIAKAVRGILEDLGMSDDPKALTAVRRHLTAIDSTAVEVEE